MKISHTRASLKFHSDDSVEFLWGDLPLFHYVARSAAPIEESPKPYFHPIRNLQGNVITNFRPNDHPWHHALSMTMTLVNGTNFWGGNTYRKDDGYRMRGNFGTQNHLDWTEVTSDESGAALRESLQWKNEHSEPIFQEQRFIDARVFPEANCWRLHLRFQLQNVSGTTLRLGTFESEEGLQGSHYTGLFFRLHREFLGKGEWEPMGSFLADGSRELPNIHGKPAPWMASVGSHDNCESETTLICCDNPKNPHFPTHWFYRPEMPCIALPFVGDSAVILDPEETLDLRYDFIIANGIQNPGSAGVLVEKCRLPSPHK